MTVRVSEILLCEACGTPALLPTDVLGWKLCGTCRLAGKIPGGAIDRAVALVDAYYFSRARIASLQHDRNAGLFDGAVDIRLGQYERILKGFSDELLALYKQWPAIGQHLPLPAGLVESESRKK